VFLDRDGVLNHPPKRDGEWIITVSDFILYDVQKPLNDLKSRGFELFVITNQSCVSRGLIGHNDIQKLHKKMLRGLPITKVYYCPHTSKENCLCRKPKPGMILQACKEFGIDAGQSWVIGDNETDVEAGKRAGCEGVKIAAGMLSKGVETILTADDEN